MYCSHWIADKPIIDDSPSMAKAASDKGQTGTLTCRAKGAPDISFAWSRDGSVINAEKSEGKMEIKSRMVDRYLPVRLCLCVCL